MEKKRTANITTVILFMMITNALFIFCFMPYEGKAIFYNWHTQQYPIFFSDWLIHGYFGPILAELFMSPYPYFAVFSIILGFGMLLRKDMAWQVFIACESIYAGLGILTAALLLLLFQAYEINKTFFVIYQVLFKSLTIPILHVAYVFYFTRPAIKNSLNIDKRLAVNIRK